MIPLTASRHSVMAITAVGNSRGQGKESKLQGKASNLEEPRFYALSSRFAGDSLQPRRPELLKRACGAISGFHSLVSSGTTPKMLDKESDARFIGYGAMIAESLVGVLALIAACSMYPGDYFAINTTPAVFSHLGLTTVNLDTFSREVGEKLAGRTGGAVSLAVGMAQIFRGLPGMDRLMGYLYHYAIMFEALFILTTIDTGTRVARYVLQELMGKVHKPFA